MPTFAMNDPSQQTPALRHAATAIVVRELHGETQVLMTRRHAALTFMGGMWVFPGGALSESDQSPAARALLMNERQQPHDLRDLTGRPLPVAVQHGLAIAAYRETFEETGVLLAQRADGAACDSQPLARIRARRKAIADDAALFAPALLAEGLRFDVERLIYWAHWITPSIGAPRRFDTRFFVVAAPDVHDHAADTYETAECLWMSPTNLLAAAGRGDMKIAQPTRYNLEDLRVSLAKHGSLAALIRNEAKRRVGAIMPKLAQQAGKTTIVMPWDAAYPDTPGESVAPGQYYEPALLALASQIERDH
jgi:8-oxo-dGTP pyrophosphatase MutT (NUDIX family)